MMNSGMQFFTEMTSNALLLIIYIMYRQTGRDLRLLFQPTILFSLHCSNNCISECTYELQNDEYHFVEWFPQKVRSGAGSAAPERQGNRISGDIVGLDDRVGQTGWQDLRTRRLGRHYVLCAEGGCEAVQRAGKKEKADEKYKECGSWRLPDWRFIIAGRQAPLSDSHCGVGLILHAHYWAKTYRQC